MRAASGCGGVHGGPAGGLGVALGERQYVASVDVAANVIQLGRRAGPGARLVRARPADDDRRPAHRTSAFRALVRIRHRGEPVPALRGAARPRADRALAGRLDRPAWAPAPGQAAVLYAPDEPARVLGGGRIEVPVPSPASRADDAHRRQRLLTVESLVPHVAPAVVLSVLVGLFDSCLYLVLRGVLRPHLLVVVPAAIVGAYIGQAVGGRVGDPVQIGDFSVRLGVRGRLGGASSIVVSLASIVPDRQSALRYGGSMQQETCSGWSWRYRRSSSRCPSRSSRGPWHASPPRRAGPPMRRTA